MISLKQEAAPQLVSLVKNWKQQLTWVVRLGFSRADTVNVLAGAAAISTLNYTGIPVLRRRIPMNGELVWLGDLSFSP